MDTFYQLLLQLVLILLNAFFAATEISKIIESLYEDKVEGKISEERYLKMSDTYKKRASQSERTG